MIDLPLILSTLVDPKAPETSPDSNEEIPDQERTPFPSVDKNCPALPAVAGQVRLTFPLMVAAVIAK